MDNEVVIEVRSEDNTRAGFDSARASGKKAGDDIERSLKESGDRGGKSWGKSLVGGLFNSGFGKAAGEALSAGLNAAKGAISSASSTPIGGALGAGVGLAAAQVAATTMGSALAAGAGVGAIGVGVGLALKNDPALQAAAKSVGQRFMEQVGKSATVYSKPIEQSLGVLSQLGDKVAANLDRAFSSTSGSVVPLVKDLASGVNRVVEAVTNIATRSRPAIEGFGTMFREVSDGVGDAIESIVGDGKGLGDSLVVIGSVIGGVVRAAGDFIGTLNKIAEFTGIMGVLADVFGDSANETDEFATATAVAADEMTNAEKAARGEKAALQALSDELRAQTDPVFGIIKAQQDLSKAQADATKAQKEHGKDSAQYKQALQAQAEAILELEGDVGKLGETFDGKMSPALRSTLRAGGMTEKAINDLEKQFGEARKQGDKFSKTYAAQMRIEGVKQARAALYGIQDIINDIPRSVNIAMKITGNTNVSRAAANIRKNMAHGGISGAASGGMRGDLTMVGEYGPELLDLPPGTSVKTNPDTQRIMREARGGDGATLGPIVIQLDGRTIATAMLPHQQEINRTRFQGDVTKMFPAGS